MRNVYAFWSKLSREALSRGSEGELPARKGGHSCGASERRSGSGYYERGGVWGAVNGFEEERKSRLGEVVESLSAAGFGLASTMQFE